MKSKEFFQNKKAIKIRKILLTFVDIELKKKKKSNHFILINSMYPNELDNIVHINQDPINISTTNFTNIAEKHLVKRIVDTKNDINYFYSDNLGTKNGMLLLKKKPDNFLIKYYSKRLRMDICMILKNDNEEYKNKEEIPIEYIHLYSFNLIKKEIGENKILSNKFLIQSNIKENNNEEKKTSDKPEEEKIEEKKKLKILSIKYLIKYCYDKIKKKLNVKSIQKYNNNILTKNNYDNDDKNDEINNNNTILKKNIYIKSKDKLLKIKKYLNNKIKEEQNKNLLLYKSTKNNCFINKFKKDLDNNYKIKHTKRGLSTNKINGKDINIKINSNDNFLGRNYEELKISNNNKNTEKKTKRKTIIKKYTRNSILDYKSTPEFSSPENQNKIKNKNKYKKSYNFIFHYKRGNTINKY